MDNYLYDPMTLYTGGLESKQKENAEEYFANLLKESGVDVQENRKTVFQYYSLKKMVEKAKNKLNGLRTGRVFSFIGCGIAYLLAIMFFVFLLTKVGDFVTDIILMFVFLAVGTGLLLLPILYLTKKIRVLRDGLSDLTIKMNQKLAEAWNQMKPLNDLYDWNSQTDIANKTTPLLHLDKEFDPKKADIFHKRFRYEENNEDYSSLYFAQSGTIVDNPYILERDYSVSMGDKTYSNSITIYWTETKHDQKGNAYTEDHSEVLTASLRRPYPYYGYNTFLFYGNDSAPDLAFRRVASGKDFSIAGPRNRYIKDRVRDIRKKAKESLIKGKGEIYTPTKNDEFEALFAADNRNNEVEFRLLFTPLGQQSMINLLRNDPFQDDFLFHKSGKLNCLRASHMEQADIYANPIRFQNFSVDDAKAKFVDYQCSYFKNLFFMMAPILTIPLYQQAKPLDYVYPESYSTNLTDSEHEILANSFNQGTFSHPDAAMPDIIKAADVKTIGSLDVVQVSAHSYRAVPGYQDFVLSGGDGNNHVVRVHYYDYTPIVKRTIAYMVRLGISRHEFFSSFLPSAVGQRIKQLCPSDNRIAFQRELLAFVPERVLTIEETKSLDAAIKGMAKIN